MKKMIKNRLVSISAVLALSAVAVGGTLALSSNSNSLSDAINTVYGNYVTASAATLNDSTGHTYYVSPSATYDASAETTTADGTATNPYHVYDVFGYYYDSNDYKSGRVTLAAGDTVIFESGTYNLDKKFQITQNGTYDNYIVLKTEDGESNAVLSFYDMEFKSTNRGVEIYGDYVYWYGINICGAGDNGLYIAGDYNIVESSEFYNNRDTGLQLGRAYSDYSSITMWPNYNLIKNCTSYNNYDNETYGENADGFAAKLTVGYGNIFDGCIAYRNSDDGWDLYAKTDSGNIGAVIIYNCVAFENGYLMESQATCNARFSTFDHSTYDETDTSAYTTRDGDGNGFKLGGSVMEGEVLMYNCMSYNNRMHGVTDNSNPGTLVLDTVTSYNNGAAINSTSGAIDYSGTTDSCNNIDVARQDYSYNVLSNILSVINGNTNTGADVYRGSVVNSMFDNGYQVTDAIDADTNYTAKSGTAYTQATATDIFTALPENTMGTDCGEYNSTTQTYPKTIHSQYRNSDGSINMGDILDVKDETIIAAGIGCDLNKTSWEDYTHYDYTYLNTCASSDDAQATAIKNMIYVPVNTAACYQDFQLVNKMMGVAITWESSNTSVIAIGETATTSYSLSSMLDAVVYRQSTDTNVTLTASVTVGSYTYTKTFTITVKAADPVIGDIEVDGVEDDKIIIDQYTLLSGISFVVYDESDYNGKTIDSSYYNVTTTYKHATDKNSTYYNVVNYTTSVAGIYEVTVTATMKDGSSSNSYTYYVYVASTDTSVEFTTDSLGNSSDSVTVNKDGFVIEGEPSNITGILYVVTTAADAEAPTAAEVVANGESYEFRSDTISAQFTNANSGAYNIYYVLTDTSGSHISSVYSANVETVNIATTSDFEAMLASNVSTKIYRLTNDIDFENATINSSSNSFVGLFNGMGYTIKNVKAESVYNSEKKEYTAGSAAIFRKVSGGTIMNVKFDNITISAQSEKSGIVGEMVSGYIYNVAVTNINITSTTNRMGAVVGQIIAGSGTTTQTYIQNVSVINESGYEITGSQRIGGIVGFIQAGSADGANQVYINNCMVSSTITGTDYVGGIVGRSDDRNANDYLEIVGCYTTGSFYDVQRLGGVLGGFTGTGVTRITNCVTTACLYYANDTVNEVTTAQKNCSGMLGVYAANADMIVTNCFAKFEEHNSNYDVYTTAGNAYLVSFWDSTPFDFETTWSMVTTETTETDGILAAPYITLNFIAVS